MLTLIALAMAAQVQVQPTEIVRATPLTPFAERAGSWPTYTSPEDVMQTESVPVEHHLNSLPGIQARASAGSPTISIRGSAQSARVLSLYDGVPLFTADGFGAPRILLPQENIGEVRILKGPASLFYGPAAMAGAVNFVPRIYDEPAVRVSLNDQNGGVANRNVFAVIPFAMNADRTEYVQATAYSDYDPGDYPFESESSGIRARRRNNGSHTHRATVLGQHEVNGWRIRERAVIAKGDGTLPGPVTTNDPTKFDSFDWLGAVDAKGKLSEDLELGVQASHLSRDDKYESAAAPTHPKSSRKLLAIDFAQTLKNAWIVRTFVDASDDHLEYAGLKKSRSLTDNLELGQIWEVPLGSGWQFQPGARWLQDTDKFIPAAAMIHSNEGAREWLTFSEGYRKPSLQDLYLNVTGYQANKNLKPESAQQLELGFSRGDDTRARQGLAYSAAIYGTHYSDFFTFESVNATTLTKVNRGDAVAYGGELSAGYAVHTHSVMLAYNHLQGYMKANHDPLTLSPRHQITAAVSQALGPFVFELKDTYASAFYDRNVAGGLQKLSDANTIDFNARSLAFSDWEFKAGILNLFNQPRELTIGYPEPQRTTYVSALRYF